MIRAALIAMLIPGCVIRSKSAATIEREDARRAAYLLSR